MGFNALMHIDVSDLESEPEELSSDRGIMNLDDLENRPPSTASQSW